MRLVGEITRFMLVPNSLCFICYRCIHLIITVGATAKSVGIWHRTATYDKATQ